MKTICKNCIYAHVMEQRVYGRHSFTRKHYVCDRFNRASQIEWDDSCEFFTVIPQQVPQAR